MGDPIALPTLTVQAEPGHDRKPAPKAASDSGWPSFHEVLSALNPLQYVPVVGTIYRSVTGDTIPESTRMAGGLIFSGLTGGPVGIATTAATDFLEKITGIDPEKIGQNILASLGLGSPVSDDTKGAPGQKATQLAAATATTTATPTAPPRPAALSASELAAYGVKQTADGNLRRGDIEGCDVLNTIELARLSEPATAAIAAAAYAVPQGKANAGAHAALRATS